VQAATASATPTARTKDACRIDLDRVVFFIAKVLPVASRNFSVAGSTFIAITPSNVDV
jgi:hypothetical protein